MRANTTTTRTIATRPSPKTWHLAVACVLAVGALALPATASAVPIDSGPYSINATGGGSNEPSQPSGDTGFASVTSITGSSESVPVSGSPSDGASYSSVTSITAPPSSEPTLVSGSPSSADDGFEWLSATIGAAAAMALVALGGAALLTVRRRTTVSPSAPSMG